MKRLSACLSVLLTTTALSAYSSGGYTFRHHTTREGLSSNSVRAILQDHTGLIWLGTASGLDSFDGREIIHHSIPDGEAGSVTSLFEDSEDILWIGTDNTVYRYVDDVITSVPGFQDTEITDIAEATDGTLWIATWGKGIFRIGENGSEAFLEGHQVEDILISRGGRIWIADSSVEEGLLVYNAASRSFVSPGLIFDGCSPARVCAIDEDDNGNLWLGTWNSGLYRLDAASRTVYSAIPPGMGLNHVHSVMHIGAWNFLLGSDDGLLEADLLTGERNLYRNDRKDPASISDKFVYPVIRDHEGGLWIGTYYGGVNYVAPNRGQFTFQSLSSLVDADEDFVISSFCEDPDGSLWIGSDNGGLFRYSPARNTAGRWTASSGWTQRLAALNIHSLLRNGDDLWIGTYSDNLVRLDVRTGRVRVYGMAEGLDASSVYALCIGPDGILWAGTNTGICRYDDQTDRFSLERNVGDWVMDIQIDQDGNLWFGTARSGILRRSPDGGWQAYSTADGLPSNYVHCLLPTRMGVFAGMQKGIALFSKEGVKTVLDNEDVRKIAFDGSQLWFSTNGDIVRHSLADGKQERFGSSDGISASVFSENAGLMTRDGTVWFGAADGIVSFYPGSVQANEIAPSVLFTRFHASGPGQFQDVFRVHGHERIVLPWKLRDVKVTFAALSYCAPDNNHYAYRLEGLENHWKDLGNENALTLNQLPAGRYRLQVVASNNSGVWNTEGASLSFTIRPHPLLSTPALALYILLAGILFYLLGRWLLIRTEKKSQAKYERALDAAVSLVKEEERDDRVHLISSLADQLEAPLAGIGVQLDKLKDGTKSPQAVKGGLSVIEKNHRMLRNVALNLQQMRTALALREGQDGETPAESTPDKEEDFLMRLDRIINENIANPELSVPFLAQELAISRSGLFAKAKELSGETPNKLINQARLNAAAKLLSEGKHTIGEICYMSGFSSPSYFSKSFVSQFGVTPHEWARMLKE
jgi:ligand-binding sensor domain-containing protein/AraC-like DNA-binding protein